MIKGVQSGRIKAVPQGCGCDPPFYIPTDLAFYGHILPCLQNYLYHFS